MVKAPKISGVTLIELLVVLTIAMTVMSLVGTLSLNSIRKAQAQTELVLLYSTLKKCGVLAFASGSLVTIELSGNAANVYSGDEQMSETIFEKLSFQHQKIGFTKTGVASDASIKVNVNGKERTLDLNFIFADYPSSIKN